MTVKYAIAGLAALAGAALAPATASAMTNGLPLSAGQSGNVENVRLVCDIYGRCFRRPNYYYGGPRFYGGGYGYGRPRFYGGGYGRRFGGRRW